eukprot:5961497-Amphidinium_carterae.2
MTESRNRTFRNSQTQTVQKREIGISEQDSKTQTVQKREIGISEQDKQKGGWGRTHGTGVPE